MSPVSLIPIFPILTITLITLSFINKRVKISPQTGRFKSIDGLRGYLAFFVFIHHSAIWYFLLREHQWGLPPSRVYSHFGPTSVSLFFMITSFLFFSKLIEAKGKNIDWLKLYTSRFLRIFPLYIFALSVLFVIVSTLSHWTLKEPIINIIQEWLMWLAFMEPDINEIGGTRLMVAGVVWSLAFEWMFYFSLPFWAFLFFKIKVSSNTTLFAGVLLIIFIIIIYYFYSLNALQRMSPFLTGMIAAFAARKNNIQQMASGKTASLLIILLLLIAIIFFPTIYSPVPYICISMAFIIIACGNSLFGILSNKVSCLLGQISYSIYLLHGILLFIIFRFMLGMSFAASQSPLVHWLIICGSSMLLVTICTLTYYFIERPCMNAVSPMTGKMKIYMKEE